MGKIFSSFVKRPQQNWNVETRAHRILDMQKPSAAPKHNPKTIESFQTEHPEFLDAQKLKNQGLHDRLSGMTVNPEKMGEIRSSRPMPEARALPADLEYGYREPERVPEGKISIKSALELLNKNTEDPQQFTAAALAVEYKLNLEDCENIVKHFHALMMHMPKDKDGKSLLMNADAVKNYLDKAPQPSLPNPDSSAKS